MAENDNAKWELVSLKFPVVQRLAQHAVLCRDGMDLSYGKEALFHWEDALASEADPQRRAKITELIESLKGDA